jgi:hypothetical protein
VSSPCPPLLPSSRLQLTAWSYCCLNAQDSSWNWS